jgi:hypothetical protein
MLLAGDNVVLGAIGLLCGLLLLLQLYFRHKFSYWRKRGIPSGEPTLLFGNFRECFLQRECVGQFMQRMYNEGAGKPFYGAYVFTRYNGESHRHSMPIPSCVCGMAVYDIAETAKLRTL